MRLPCLISRATVAALACGGAAAFAADPPETVTYRCPGNDYKNTISAKEAERLGCKKLEGTPITVIQMTKPRGSGTSVPAASGTGAAKVDPAAQRARDSDARRILEAELKGEEERLAALKKEFNNGQPERQGNEKNYQTYVDRVAQLSAAIARKEADIAAIRREIQKLPAPAPTPL
ncbi:MAG: hypothetical protein ACXWCU_03255 [Caldimonas sp.]